MGGLAGAVAACGGMGTISTADVGFQEPDFDRDPLAANLRALKAEIRKARELAHGAGMVAVNAMVATRQFADAGADRRGRRGGRGSVRRGAAAGAPRPHPGQQDCHRPHRLRRAGGQTDPEDLGPEVSDHRRLCGGGGLPGRRPPGLP